MTDPIIFPSTSPRFSLPLLFVGQAQKEVTVNEAMTLIDLLLHGAVEAVSSEPPAAPLTGQCWIVGPEPTGAWSGRAHAMAAWTGGGWRFVAPTSGMKVFDRAVGAYRHFDGQWQMPSAPPLPEGGETVDEQARAVLSNLVAALISAGVFRNS